MAATVDPPHLMDILTLADDLGVSVSHTRRLVHERQIPFITLARLVRFDQGRYQPQRHRILVTTERVLREVTGPGQTRLSRSTGVRPATWSGYPHPPVPGAATRCVRQRMLDLGGRFRVLNGLGG